MQLLLNTEIRLIYMCNQHNRSLKRWKILQDLAVYFEKWQKRENEEILSEMIHKHSYSKKLWYVVDSSVRGQAYGRQWGRVGWGGVGWRGGAGVGVQKCIN